MTTLHDPAVDAKQDPLPASLPADAGAVEGQAVVAASPAPAELECPALGEHAWSWHTEDGCGRPITPGVYCDECAERHPDDDEFATRRHWERAGI